MIPGLTLLCRVCSAPSLVLRSDVLVRSVLCPVTILLTSVVIREVIRVVLLVTCRVRVVRVP